MYVFRNIALTLAIAFLSISGAAAQEQTGWELKCNSTKCQLEYQQIANEKVVTGILIYRVGDVDVLEFTVPLSISLQKGVTVRVDVNPDIRSTMLTCEQEKGCLGFITLEPIILDLFKGGENLQLIVQSFREKKYYAFTFTLSGFTAAYKGYLEKQTK